MSEKFDAARRESEPMGMEPDYNTYRCGHNYPTDRCPHPRCGYREALARVAELEKHLQTIFAHAAHYKIGDLKHSGPWPINDTTVGKLCRGMGEGHDRICDLKEEIDRLNKVIDLLRCPECKGVGTVMEIHFPGAVGGFEDVTCSLCRGSGTARTVLDEVERLKVDNANQRFYIRRVIDNYSYHLSAGYFMPDIFDGTGYDTEAKARENIRILEQSDRVHKRVKVAYDVVAVIEIDRKEQQ